MNMTTEYHKFQQEILTAIRRCRHLTALHILHGFLGGKTVHSSQLSYITARCDKRLAHVGIEVESINRAILFAQSLPEKLNLISPVFKSTGVPQRFRGSTGKIALLTNKKKIISLELFEIKWAPEFKMIEPAIKKRFIEHTALKVKSFSALYEIISALSKKQVKIDLPITKNKADGATFVYFTNQNSDRLEFVYYDDKKTD